MNDFLFFSQEQIACQLRYFVINFFNAIRLYFLAIVFLAGATKISFPGSWQKSVLTYVSSSMIMHPTFLVNKLMYNFLAIFTTTSALSLLTASTGFLYDEWLQTKKVSFVSVDRAFARWTRISNIPLRGQRFAFIDLFVFLQELRIGRTLRTSFSCLSGNCFSF